MAVQFEFYKNPFREKKRGNKLSSQSREFSTRDYSKTGSRNSLGNYLWQGRSGSNVNGTQSVHGQPLTRRAKSTS